MILWLVFKRLITDKRKLEKKTDQSIANNINAK